MTTERTSKQSLVHDFLVKYPDAGPKEVAKKFNCVPGTYYAVKKKLREEASDPGSVSKVSKKRSVSKDNGANGADNEFVQAIKKIGLRRARLIMDIFETIKA